MELESLSNSFRLRPLVEPDAPAVLDYLVRNRETHAPWSPDPPPGFFTLAYQQDRVALYTEANRRGVEHRFVIVPSEDDGYVIGAINLVAVERGAFLNGRFGYSMDEHWSGRGVMTVALGLAVDFGFDDLQLHRVEANIMPRNYPSRRVLEKCGFRRVGFSPRMLCISGVWEDHEMFALLVDDRPG